MSENLANKYISEGILLAGIPFLAYLITFAYQAGYASYFGIPKQFIVVDLTTTLISTAGVIGVIYFAFPVVNLLWMFAPRKVDPISFAVRRFVKISIICFVCMLPFLHKWMAWLAFIIFLILIAISEFVLPMLTRKEKSTYAEKLKAEIEADVHDGQLLLWHEIDKRVGRWLVTSLIYAYMALVFSYSMGLKNAETKRVFYTIGENRVILAIYDETLVTSSYDPDTMVLNESISVNNYKDGENVSLVKKRLTLKKVGDQSSNVPKPTQ